MFFLEAMRCQRQISLLSGTQWLRLGRSPQHVALTQAEISLR